MAAVEVAWKSLWHEIYTWRCVVSMMIQDDSRCADRTWDWHVAALWYENATCMVFSITKRRSLLWSESSEKTTFSDSCQQVVFSPFINIKINSLKLKLTAKAPENGWFFKSSFPWELPGWRLRGYQPQVTIRPLSGLVGRSATHDVLQVSVVGEKRMEKKIPQKLKGTYFLLKVEGFEGILSHSKCQEFCKTQKFL